MRRGRPFDGLGQDIRYCPVEPLAGRLEPRSARRAVSCLAVASVLVAASVVLLGCGDNPTAPTSSTTPQQSIRDQCLTRAVFGDPATSAYVLPFPVGASYPLLQTYCGPQNHGRDNQLAFALTNSESHSINPWDTRQPVALEMNKTR